MRLRRQSVVRVRALMVAGVVLVVLGALAAGGHGQWTVGGPSGIRGRGVGFDAAGNAAWREAGVSLFRGAAGVWVAERSVAKVSFDWGGGGAVFFGVDDEVGGPRGNDSSVWWRPNAGLGSVQKGAGGRSWFVTVPLWPLAGLVLVWAAVEWRRGRIGRGACQWCGYERTGLGGGVACPECGRGEGG
ncbi:MAG: hypothetical protein JSR77_13715 [Planctomycetes bacterium]|nr:hypothetical protein [Planctomycetota bacterium]